jgi:hypothetical protein
MEGHEDEPPPPGPKFGEQCRVIAATSMMTDNPFVDIICFSLEGYDAGRYSSRNFRVVEGGFRVTSSGEHSGVTHR